MKNKLWWVVFTIGAVLTMYNAVAAEWNDKPVICEQREVFEDVIKTRGEIPISIGQILAKVRDPDGSDGLSDIPAVLPITLYINPKTKTFTITEYHATYNSVCVLAFGENWSGIGKSM